MKGTSKGSEYNQNGKRGTDGVNLSMNSLKRRRKIG